MAQWTFVTFFFDLTKRPNCSPDCRSPEHYLREAEGTLSIPYNLIIFCDAELEDYFYAKRKEKCLEEKTVVVAYVPTLLSQEYVQRVTENRLLHFSYREDPRNDAYYYLMCMTRYEVLLRAMKFNPFGSSYFGWINICIQRMGGLEFLPEIVKCGREKVSMVCMDYHPKKLAHCWPRYFEFGRASLCSGFFTGLQKYLKPFCKAMLAKFHNCLQAGFGHADEQIMFLCYLDRPAIFELYFGDYYSMLSNYVQPRKEEGLQNFHNLIFPKAQEDKNWDLLRMGCRFICGTKTARMPLQIPETMPFHILEPYLFGPKDEFFGRPGYQHYRLLAYISATMLSTKATIVDIGTHMGSSALALSFNPSHMVHTFDVEDMIPETHALRKKENIVFHTRTDIFQNLRQWKELLLGADLLFFDVAINGGEHTGRFELDFLDFLRKEEYKGIVIWDDIYAFPGMRKFWQHASNMKDVEASDLSDIGHWSGTGMTKLIPRS